MNCHREETLEKQPHLTNWVPIAVPISKWILWPPPFNFYPAAMGPVVQTHFFKMYEQWVAGALLHRISCGLRVLTESILSLQIL